jgi:hypothetical protein
MNKILAVIASLLVLTGCTAPVETKDDKGEVKTEVLLNINRHKEVWDDKVEVNFYLLGFGKVDEKSIAALDGIKLGTDVVAVRYEFTNLTDEPIDIYGLNIGNAGFNNNEKPVGTINFSETSLHSALGFKTIPADWDASGKWIIPAKGKADISLDWVVESKDYIMNYWWKMPFEKDTRQFSVSLKP